MLGSIPPFLPPSSPHPFFPPTISTYLKCQNLQSLLKKKAIIYRKRIFCWWLQLLIKSKNTVYNNKKVYGYYISAVPTHLWVKVNSTWSLTASTLLHRLVLLSVCFIYPMYGRCSTNWDRKGLPGSEIQMYYGCPCTFIFHTIEKYNLLLIFLHFS